MTTLRASPRELGHVSDRARRQSRQERRRLARKQAVTVLAAHYTDTKTVRLNLSDLPMEMLVHIFEYVAACADLAAWCNQHVTVKLIARVVLLGNNFINGALCMVYNVDSVTLLMQKLREVAADQNMRWCANIGMNLFKKITFTYGDGPAETVYDRDDEMMALNYKFRTQCVGWKQFMEST